jgi:predicted DsbA family dithiol-disulfide isomerase
MGMLGDEAMNVKILGTGCPACRSMVNDVTRIIARHGWKVDVEYVQDIERIMSYGVMSTPVLVIGEKVVMVGHRGSSKIEQVLHDAVSMQVS